MPFIPHTSNEVQEMLKAIGVADTQALFDEIPLNLRAPNLAIPEGLNELDMTKLMQARAHQDQVTLNFIGAGSYQHHIPAAVWEIVGRGEWMTAYTPYQAEASQGSLQLIYEYQTMMASLMGLDVSNASLYDGASALAEAVLMAVRCNKASQAARVLILGAISPSYERVLKTIVKVQGIEVVTHRFAMGQTIDQKALAQLPNQEFTAVVIPQPQFLGELQPVDLLTDWAHSKKALVIGLVNPLAMSLLKAPGQWGQIGADIACGEGQPLGIPMASGGPYFGFLCCKREFVRQMPGRIVGRTTDQEGKPGFCLTLQAREQHIRRAKATSNICTNQGLLVTAATIYMSLLGPEGLKRVAASCHHHAANLKKHFAQVPHTKVLTQQPFFHEFVVQLSRPVAEVLEVLAQQGIQGGFDLTQDFPELGQSLLICSTEVHDDTDHQTFLRALNAVL